MEESEEEKKEEEEPKEEESEASNEQMIVYLDPDDYKEDTRKNRELQTAKFSTIRKWIMDASSETDIPRIILGKETLDPLEGGILSRSRSEMEEEMWRIDSTPLFQLDENETEKGLANELFVSYIAGFTSTIVDKSEGLFKIRQDIRKILYNAGLLGISAIGFAFVLSTVMVKNIRQISKNAQLVGKGNLQIQFDVKSKDEIGMLSSTLNQMVNGLIERKCGMAGEPVQFPSRLPSHK